MATSENATFYVIASVTSGSSTLLSLIPTAMNVPPSRQMLSSTVKMRARQPLHAGKYWKSGLSWVYGILVSISPPRVSSELSPRRNRFFLWTESVAALGLNVGCQHPSQQTSTPFHLALRRGLEYCPKVSLCRGSPFPTRLRNVVGGAPIFGRIGLAGRERRVF